jgi:Flp pilus assembly protein TadD
VSRNATYERAAELFDLGRYDDAVELLVVVVARDPEEVEPLALLGRCHLAREDFQQAHTAAQEVVRLAPDWSEGYRQHCVIWLACGDAKEALRAGAAAVRCDPHEPKVLSALAQAQAVAGNVPAAQTTIGQLMTTAPRWAGTHLAHGIVAEAAGDITLAEAAFRHAVSLDPHDPELLLRLGGARRAGADWREALDVQLAAVRADPGRVAGEQALQLKQMYERPVVAFILTAGVALCIVFGFSDDIGGVVDIVRRNVVAVLGSTLLGVTAFLWALYAFARSRFSSQARAVIHAARPPWWKRLARLQAGTLLALSPLAYAGLLLPQLLWGTGFLVAALLLLAVASAPPGTTWRSLLKTPFVLLAGWQAPVSSINRIGFEPLIKPQRKLPRRPLRIGPPPTGKQRVIRFGTLRAVFFMMLSVITLGIAGVVTVATASFDSVTADDWKVAWAVIGVAIAINLVLVLSEWRWPLRLPSSGARMGVVDARTGKRIGPVRAIIRATLRLLLAPLAPVGMVLFAKSCARLPHDVLTHSRAVMLLEVTPYDVAPYQAALHEAAP